MPAIPSYELAGVVEEAGTGVAGVAPGDEVFALTPFDRDGVAADFAIVPAEALAARPRSLPLGRVRELGAQEAVDAETSFADAVEPVDLVFDTVGGQRLRRSRAVLRPGGRLVSVAEEPPDGGEYFIVEVNHVQLAEIARLADAGEL